MVICILSKLCLYSMPLIVIVSILSIYLKKYLSKRIVNVLWYVVLIRLLVPVFIPASFSFYNLSIPIRNVNYNLFNLDSFKYMVGYSDLTFALTIIWLVGVAVTFLLILSTHLKLKFRYDCALPLQNDYIDSWLKSHKIFREITVKQSDMITSPITYGLFKPVIILPKKFDLKNKKMIDYVLYHEFIHIKNFDIVKKSLLVLTISLYWFNPFVWLAYICANRDIEFACDETVIHKLGIENKINYAETLIELEESKTGPIILCSNFSKNITQLRLMSILHTKANSKLAMMISIIILVLLVIMFLTSDYQPVILVSKTITNLS